MNLVITQMIMPVTKQQKIQKKLIVEKVKAKKPKDFLENFYYIPEKKVLLHSAFSLALSLAFSLGLLLAFPIPLFSGSDSSSGSD